MDDPSHMWMSLFGSYFMNKLIVILACRGFRLVLFWNRLVCFNQEYPLWMMKMMLSLDYQCNLLLHPKKKNNQRLRMSKYQLKGKSWVRSMLPLHFLHLLLHNLNLVHNKLKEGIGHIQENIIVHTVDHAHDQDHALDPDPDQDQDHVHLIVHTVEGIITVAIIDTSTDIIVHQRHHQTICSRHCLHQRQKHRHHNQQQATLIPKWQR